MLGVYISKSSMCCNLPTRRINNRCWYRVRICVALDGRSKLKASTQGLRVAMGFTLTTTITLTTTTTTALTTTTTTALTTTLTTTTQGVNSTARCTSSARRTLP